jgi:hypothetical protein
MSGDLKFSKAIGELQGLIIYLSMEFHVFSSAIAFNPDPFRYSWYHSSSWLISILSESSLSAEETYPIIKAEPTLHVNTFYYGL